jgi:uncharacterized protein (TIGR03437 family)
MLGRVAATSININVVFDQDMQAYVEYGTVSGAYTGKTNIQTTTANTPMNIALTNLQPNTRYYYRLQYANAGSTTFTARPERTFMTQRPRGSTFTFLLQADPHLDNNSNAAVYQQTLANELADKADFLIDVGDTMLSDKLNPQGIPVDGGAGGGPNAAGVLTRTRLLRSYYDIATHSVPLFLAVGNHEGEWGRNLNGTPNNVAIWDTQDRTGYFANPTSDGFFSGDTNSYDVNGNLCVPTESVTCGLGQRRSYYSWEWGDTLFIVLDPYWYQTTGKTVSQAGGGQNCCQNGDWSLTLGTAQYNWLKQTLENSAATYKFVFAHNLVGGYNNVVNGTAQGAMRGGVEFAKYLEWGGYNLDGTWGFDQYRPELPMPIHQLLVANHVTAFFHGHDHLYAHQELDGITYQETPQPSANNTNLGTRASDYGYLKGTMLGGRGYLRVTVSPDKVDVNYIETWLPSETNADRTNGMVADSYSISPHSAESKAPAIWSVTNAAGSSPMIAPNTWVTIMGSSLAPAGITRSWAAADFVNGQLPTRLDGVSVTVNSRPAFVSFIDQGQINILTPPDALPASAPVQVTVNGSSSAVFTARTQALSPSLFVINGGAYVAATHADGSLIGPTALIPKLTTPAKPGETIVLYANGFGTTSTPVVSGSMSQGGTLSPLPVVNIGRTAATVQFAGLVGPGLFQFNVVVPPNAASGNQAITASYNGQSTPAGTLLAVQQ